MTTGIEKKASKESGLTLPLADALPRWMERLDEFFTERWPPFLPTFHLPEQMLPRVPPIDVYEEGDSLVVKAEVPGMKKEEIELRVTGDLLTISGSKTREEKIERKDYSRFERSEGSFSRTVKLPAPVVGEKVTAAYKDGVLEIRAPKAEPARSSPRKVVVS